MATASFPPLCFLKSSGVSVLLRAHLSPCGEYRTSTGQQLVGLFTGYSRKLVPDSAQTI